MMETKVEIDRATAEEMPIISNLLQLYLYEFSPIVRTDVEADGRFKWDGLEDYWNDKNLHPILIRVGGLLAGFALVQRFSVVRNKPVAWDMEDFFIMAKYSRTGIGKYVAGTLFNQFRGDWEIRVLQKNDSALRFWGSTVSRYCGTETAPVLTPVGSRAFNVFRFETT